MFSFECMKINEILNRFLVVADKFMPEMHLKQPGFTYSACGHSRHGLRQTQRMSKKSSIRQSFER